MREREKGGERENLVKEARVVGCEFSATSKCVLTTECVRKRVYA